MNIQTCDKYTLEELKLEKPIKVEDVYISNINFTIQTPKLLISKVSKKITLLLNEKMEQILSEFDNKIMSLISKNSEEFFEDTISNEEVEDIYKHSFKQSKIDSKISLSINKKLSVFNKHKEKLELCSLTEGDIVICLIKCKKIVFYKSHCEPLWEVFQIKTKEPEFKTDKYLFREDTNDTYEENNNSDTEEICDIKKIKMKK
jgi:hypothetical protein